MDGLQFEIDPPETPAVVAAPGADAGDVDPFAGEALEAQLAEEVTTDEVEAALEAVGLVLNETAADVDVPRQWLWNDVELALVVPGGTRLVNRFDRARRIVKRLDWLWVAAGTAKYLKRNVQDGAEARQRREENEHGHIGREDREGAADPARPDDAGVGPWGHGAPPDETAGLGQFQG